MGHPLDEVLRQLEMTKKRQTEALDSTNRKIASLQEARGDKPPVQADLDPVKRK